MPQKIGRRYKPPGPCLQRFSVRPAWAASQLPTSIKHRLIEMFALGMPAYPQGEPFMQLNNPSISPQGN